MGIDEISRIVIDLSYSLTTHKGCLAAVIQLSDELQFAGELIDVVCAEHEHDPARGLVKVREIANVLREALSGSDREGNKLVWFPRFPVE